MTDAERPDPDPQPPRLPHQVAGRRQRVNGEPAIVLVQQTPGFFRSMFSWFGWIVLGLLMMVLLSSFAAQRDYFDSSAGTQEKFHSLSRLATDKVAIIDASGVLMVGDGFIKKQIDRVRADDNVKAVVLRVDSPGGTITAADYILHHLRKLRDERELPLVVSMGSMAASGGYYIAMAVGDQEQSIYAEPTTTTGSIGVIIPHYDITGLMERYDVKDDSIATHPRKQMLSMTKALSEDDREILSNYIGHAFDRFKDVVKQGRPKFEQDEAALDELATGEIFTAKQALESGLVDELGFIEEAVDRAVELAGLDKENTRVVTYKRPITFLDAIGSARTPAPSGLAQLFELATPKAYYLATSLPSLIVSE